MDSQDLTMRFVAVDQISRVLDQIGGALKQVGEWAKGVGGAIGDAFGTAFTAIGSVLPVIGGVLVAAGGLFAGVDALVTQQGKYALAIESTSNRLGIHTDLLQTMVGELGLAGVSQDTVNLSLTRFAANLDKGGASLKQMHLTLKDLGITSRDVNTAILQLADTFHNSDDAAMKAGVSMALFGRNTVAMTAFLDQGTAGIQAANAELAKFGVVLNDGQLALATTGRVMQDQFHLVLQGLGNTIAQAAMPALMMLWDVLGKLLDPLGKAGFMVDALAHAFATAVTWVAGFISVVTGVPISLDDITTAMNSAISAFSLAAGTATDAGNTITQSTAGSTQAIQDQIQTIQDRQTAFDESQKAQVDGVNALKSSYDDLMDSEIKQLDLQRQQLEYAHQLAGQNKTLADLQTQMATDRADLAAAPFLGITNTGALSRQLLTDQQKLLDAQATQKFDAQIHDLDMSKQALRDQKSLQDQAYQDQITGINAVTKAQDDAFKDVLKGLQEQEKAITRAAASGVAAFKDAGPKMADALDLPSQKLTLMHEQLTGPGTGLTAGLSDVLGSGIAAAAGLAKAFGPDGDLQKSLKGVADLFHTIGDGVHALQMAGPGMYVAGALDKLTGGAKVPFLEAEKHRGVSSITAESEFVKAFNGDHPTTDQWKAAGYAKGGPVPGDGPQRAVVHGGEFVVPQGGALVSSGDEEQKDILRRVLTVLEAIANDRPAPGGWAASRAAG